MATLAITLGEPAGIGPDIVASALQNPSAHRRIVIGCATTLKARAQQLGLAMNLVDYGDCPYDTASIEVIDCPTEASVIPGTLNTANAASVLQSLARAAHGALRGEFDAIITAPVQKSVINDAGVSFSGHTEFFAEMAGVPKVVMMLVAGSLRVALVTTHLPLSAVPKAITSQAITETLNITQRDLQQHFGIANPRLAVLGLNPHAGEGGHLGREEIEIIAPCLEQLKSQGFDLLGPLPADTAFQPLILDQVDAVIAQYHDQGLPVLKYAGFGEAVNVTLGLPFVRTSVDHGTALDLAGTGRAKTGSFSAAFELAATLANLKS
ncbi:MAG: 4-hydroxythreonine-4-phosphate dehydrogenase PdxA [Aequoribacter sp.]|uniref:4-hydroxythreonine-4-phosphate dehydrogenase PdxA n=1 Tax=Aequoribacter sp. TaxID=2847771 RepID=UPI003C40ED65